MVFRAFFVALVCMAIISVGALAGQSYISTMDKPEQEAFLSAVKEYYGSIGIAATITDDWTVVTGDGDSLSLENLARICGQYPIDQWNLIVEQYIGRSMQAQAERKELEPLMGDYDAIKPHLSVHIWPLEVLDYIGPDRAVYREDLEGLYTIMALDLPSSVAPLNPSETAPWGKSTDELIDAALEVVWHRDGRGLVMFDLLEDDHLYAVENPGSFVSPFILMLDRMPGLIGKHGSLVSLPSREVMLVYPIEGAKLLDSLGAFIAVTNVVYEQVPGPVSVSVYWYTDSKFIPVPYRYGMMGFDFAPPEPFIDLLMALEAEAEL